MTRKRSPKKPDKRQAWFKYQLDLAGSSYQAIGDMVGKSRNAVRQSILSPPPDTADAISQTLGMSRSELWPSRYPADNRL